MSNVGRRMGGELNRNEGIVEIQRLEPRVSGEIRLGIRICI